MTEIAYEHFNQFAKVYGDRYITSNVQIINPSTGEFEYIGKQYRYFTTEQGTSSEIPPSLEAYHASLLGVANVMQLR